MAKRARRRRREIQATGKGDQKSTIGGTLATNVGRGKGWAYELKDDEHHP